MKIAIIGYGKMGHAVEKAAIERGHQIVSIIDIDNHNDIDSDAFRSADVAIEFSNPEAAWGNFRDAWAQGVPVVSGSTGWFNPLKELELIEECKKGATLFHAPNFSVGVNVMNAAAILIARLLAPYTDYSTSIHEVHHVHKLDHPSGTAILLANAQVEHSKYDAWGEPQMGPIADNAIPVTHERRGEVPGIHEITWDSPFDTITLRHEAKGREGFAIGAVACAEWLLKHPRGAYYTIGDMYKEILK